MIEKKVFGILLILSLALMLSSCGKTENTEQQTAAVQTEPGTELFETGYRAYFSEEENETDYSNIVCFAEQETYPADAERIDITVKNQNIGKGFWVSDWVFVDRLDNGEWVRLLYDEEYYQNVSGIPEKWYYCYVETGGDISHSSRVCVNTKNLAEPLTEGDYRAVVFVGKEVIYAPFRIEK